MQLEPNFHSTNSTEVMQPKSLMGVIVLSIATNLLTH